jgi:hypothetical protein
MVYTSRDIRTEKDPKSQWSVTIELVHEIKKKYLFSFVYQKVFPEEQIQ